MVSRQHRRTSLVVSFAVVGVAVALPLARAQAKTSTVEQAAAPVETHGLRLNAGTLRLRNLPVALPLRLADTVVEPAPVAPAPAPVVEEPRRTVRTEVVQEHHNYMSTLALSAIMGGVLGAVVGAAVYFIDKGEHARNIAYWTAGGVLVGAGVGLVEVLVEESRTSAAMSNAPADPAPTLRFALYQHRF